MRFSTPLVLYAAFVTGVFHTVTANAIPHLPSSSNPSTGRHTVLHQSVPTPTSNLGGRGSSSDLDNLSTAMVAEAVHATKRGVGPSPAEHTLNSPKPNTGAGDHPGGDPGTSNRPSPADGPPQPPFTPRPTSRRSPQNL
ncbi:hypothetical protein BC835DRAFT_1410984 [Cytidiella melzeri]|nr:hypothetical protein BC835DRAFT_1410984 [Cytidiella melzeri]